MFHDLCQYSNVMGPWALLITVLIAFRPFEFGVPWEFMSACEPGTILTPYQNRSCRKESTVRMLPTMQRAHKTDS